MPTERKVKRKKKQTSSSTRQTKTTAGIKTLPKSKLKAKKTAASRRIVRPNQQKISERPAATVAEQPIPGREIIISATKIAMGTKDKASKLFKAASDFFSNQAESGRSVIHTIAGRKKVRRAIKIAEALPEKVNKLRRNRKVTK